MRSCAKCFKKISDQMLMCEECLKSESRKLYEKEQRRIYGNKSVYKMMNLESGEYIGDEIILCKVHRELENSPDDCILNAIRKANGPAFNCIRCVNKKGS